MEPAAVFNKENDVFNVDDMPMPPKKLQQVSQCTDFELPSEPCDIFGILLAKYATHLQPLLDNRTTVEIAADLTSKQGSMERDMGSGASPVGYANIDGSVYYLLVQLLMFVRALAVDCTARTGRVSDCDSLFFRFSGLSQSSPGTLHLGIVPH